MESSEKRPSIWVHLLISFLVVVSLRRIGAPFYFAIVMSFIVQIIYVVLRILDDNDE